MQSALFKGLSGDSVVAAFSSRNDGNMSLFHGEIKNSLANRKEFLGKLGVDYRDLVCAKQSHANSVELIREADKGRGALSYENSLEDTDAFITDLKNTPLAIFTADCLSVFLYDPGKPAVGIVHAGWRSSRRNITAKAIRLMQKKFNTRTEDLYVSFGPAIRSCCYKVGRELKSYFPHSTLEKDGRYYLDLVKENQQQVLQTGLSRERMFDCAICTACGNSGFFSWRREGPSCGRLISVIMLK